MSTAYGSGATATSEMIEGTPNHSSVIATAVTASIAIPTPAIHRARRDAGKVASRTGGSVAAVTKANRRGTRIASQIVTPSTISAMPSPMRSYGSVEYVNESVGDELWVALRW